MRTLLAAVAVLTVLAGCAGAPAPAGSTAPGPSRAQELAEGLPPLHYDVAAAVAEWEHLSTAYPKHDADLPNNLALRDHLVDRLRAFGMRVEVKSYPGAFMGVGIPGTTINAIVATKAGTTHPDHAIALGSHYDSQSATVDAAYDNKSGTAVDLAACQALANVTMEKTLVCLFFDGEERGLVGSRAYVDDVVAHHNASYVLDAYFGFDMVGLNWPGYTAWKYYLWHGEHNSTGAYALSKGLVTDVMHLPADGVAVVDHNERSSDELSFDAAGIPVVRFSGGRAASDYPMYHLPGDTVQYVDLLAGGREAWVKGFDLSVHIAYVEALMFDRANAAELAS